MITCAFVRTEQVALNKKQRKRAACVLIGIKGMSKEKILASVSTKSSRSSRDRKGHGKRWKRNRSQRRGRLHGEIAADVSDSPARIQLLPPLTALWRCGSDCYAPFGP